MSTDDEATAEKQRVEQANAELLARLTRAETARATWEWYVFGDPRMSTVIFDIQIPLWRRILTRLLLGSTWIRR